MDWADSIGSLLGERREPQAEKDGRAGGEEAGDDCELICAAPVADALAGRVIGHGCSVGRYGLHSTKKEIRWRLARRKRRAADTGCG